MAYDPNETSEQMAFSFYDEMEPRKRAALERDFDTEEDALDALLDNGSEPEKPAPHPLECDCCCAVSVPDPAEQANPPSPETHSGERGSLSDEPAKMPEDVPPFAAPFTVADDKALSALDQIEQAERGNQADAAGDEPEETVIVLPAKSTPFPPLTDQTIRRAAAGFLATLKPDGIGLHFSSGIPRVKIDAGAYFLSGGKVPQVTRTVLVVTGVDRDKCWIDASEKEKLLAMLAAAKEEKASLEEMLKQKEPGLKDDSLFPESQTWDFTRTKNRKYHACLHKIEKIESLIYHGSKFERMLFEKLADEYYLAVPKDLIAADELPEAWGLIYIADDFSATVIRPAKKCDCPAENKMSFVFHAASAHTDSFLLANGISVSDGIAKFYLPPKRRKAYC